MSGPAAQNNNHYKYIALGDSYTVGEAVPQHESFPYQLKEALANNAVLVETPLVIAKTGWTTDELMMATEAEEPGADYAIATLLIGVNNQYRGYSTAVYRAEFKTLLQQAVAFAGADRRRVFVLSIPDWSVTPFGKDSGRDMEAIAAEIALFNGINQEETLAMGISYTDITPASRKAESEPDLLAADGLHPSGKMYSQWAAALVPVVLASFS